MELELTKKQFLHDIENHEMQIYKDDGIFRCITFKKENTSNQQFTITTFPNYLVITGDMGDFVFTRLEDMFNFFRGENIHKSY